MRRWKLVTVLLALFGAGLLPDGPLWGLTLEEAKSKGLVGEKPNGYLGLVAPSSQEVQALASDINQKRRQAYEDIARKNGTQVTEVEALAGEKAIKNTKQGLMIQTPSGQWIKKQ